MGYLFRGPCKVQYTVIWGQEEALALHVPFIKVYIYSREVHPDGCYCLNFVLICFLLVFSVFSDKGLRDSTSHHLLEPAMLHTFVNYKLHSTLYSTLLIYPVKAYFKRKPYCVYLSKFIETPSVLVWLM